MSWSALHKEAKAPLDLQVYQELMALMVKGVWTVRMDRLGLMVITENPAPQDYQDFLEMMD